ncbi:MAG: PDZ domain-containing protein, partial [Pseudomonadota bacterium]|nr:PDZ domain-containing protein [Pseudomonadota bacterium]
LAASFLSLQCVPSSPALAANPMGYQLLSAQQAAELPRHGGALGMDVGPGQRLTDAGMTFELLRVNGVRQGSPGAQAGFKAGDQIIAADGRVFPSVAAFAAYVGSVPPGRQITVDYMPAGGGPQQAQRVAVTVGAGGRAMPALQNDRARSTGLSTGTKLAIGAGAAALLGCYELGCFSRSKAGSGDASQQQPQQPVEPQQQR